MRALAGEFWSFSFREIGERVLDEKPTEEDSTITAVGDTSAADHVNVDDVCMAHIRAEDLEEPQTSTFFKNEYDKSSYDLGNFTNKILSDNEKRQILDMGPLQPSGPFPTDINQNNRCFSKSYDVSSSKYGPVNRFWLCYSKIIDAAYCQPCWLFASQRNNVWCMGIRDWKHLSERIKQHSCSSSHSEACAVYEFWKKKYTNTIDKEFENEIRKEASFWKMVLQRLFDIILTLAKSSLALRGHREDLSQEGYHGNFLSFVELVARYDHILRQVLDMPKGSTRYSSATIQNEMIEILGTKLETHLLEQIKASPFFAIIMDTTQDISKVDQLSIVVSLDSSGAPFLDLPQGPWLPSYATGSTAYKTKGTALRYPSSIIMIIL
ncbi:Zinc finger MYM-type protein 1 [Eumeta japonica]|uniref:Zinc finger MYM-type protein 1 n=1 Tax=Eumeta variegata TaxID=151549 RepID=A0A4C1TEI1_EUMVA|nr:Zinc finger MYM-type protein 1 [Eumeta japonica]